MLCLDPPLPPGPSWSRKMILDFASAVSPSLRVGPHAVYVLIASLWAQGTEPVPNARVSDFWNHKTAPTWEATAGFPSFLRGGHDVRACPGFCFRDLTGSILPEASILEPSRGHGLHPTQAAVQAPFS